MTRFGFVVHPGRPQAVEAAAEVQPEWREIKPGHWVQACPCFT